jgi:hypothetical protein
MDNIATMAFPNYRNFVARSKTFIYNGIGTKDYMA